MVRYQMECENECEIYMNNFILIPKWELNSRRDITERGEVRLHTPSSHNGHWDYLSYIVLLSDRHIHSRRAAGACAQHASRQARQACWEEGRQASGMGKGTKMPAKKFLMEMLFVRRERDELSEQNAFCYAKQHAKAKQRKRRARTYANAKRGGKCCSCARAVILRARAHAAMRASARKAKAARDACFLRAGRACRAKISDSPDLTISGARKTVLSAKERRRMPFYF